MRDTNRRTQTSSLATILLVGVACALLAGSVGIGSGFLLGRITSGKSAPNTAGHLPTRQEFKNEVIGLTTDQLIAKYGRPARTQDQGETSVWCYEWAVIDEVSQKTAPLTFVEVKQGRVVRVF